MPEHRTEIPEERDLRPSELKLIRWLLEHGSPEGLDYIPQLEGLTVVSRCACGCPSINFIAERSDGMNVLADYMYDDPKGGKAGVFVFSVGGRLAGLDIWSIDGVANPDDIPDPNESSAFEVNMQPNQCKQRDA